MAVSIDWGSMLGSLYEGSYYSGSKLGFLA